MDNYCVVYSESEENDEYSQYSLESTIDEWDHPWKEGVVTYKVTKGSKNFPNTDWESKALTIALRTWGLCITNLKFKRTYNVDDRADIELKFLPASDDVMFKKSPGVLAYAYFPTYSAIGGDITFNDDYLWTKNGAPIDAETYMRLTGKQVTNMSNKFKTWNIIHTLIHECGHALGLKHNNSCEECIMYPFYNGKVTLASNDVSRIQSFYGKRSLSSYWNKYWVNRMIREFKTIE